VQASPLGSFVLNRSEHWNKSRTRGVFSEGLLSRRAVVFFCASEPVFISGQQRLHPRLPAAVCYALSKEKYRTVETLAAYKRHTGIFSSRSTEYFVSGRVRSERSTEKSKHAHGRPIFRTEQAL
jgi:hypothetical protein